MKMGGNRKEFLVKYVGLRRGTETTKDRIIVSVKFVTLMRMGTRFKLGVEVGNTLTAVCQDFNCPFSRARCRKVRCRELNRNCLANWTCS